MIGFTLKYSTDISGLKLRLPNPNYYSVYFFDNLIFAFY